MDDFEEELKRDFLTESEDMLSSAEGAFLRLETDRDDPELLNEIFRIAHNLKGTSRAVGLDQVAEVTHIAENLILKVKEGEMEATDHVVTVLLKFNDKIVEMVDGLKDDLDARFETEEIVALLEAAVNGEGAASEEAVVVVEEPAAIEEELAVPDASAFEDEAVEVASEDTPSSPQISSAAIEAMKEAGIFDESEFEGLSADTTAEISNEDQKILEEFQNSIGDTDAKEVSGLSVPAAEPTPVPEPVAKKVEEKKKAPAKKRDKAASKTEESVRVNLGRIETLNNIVGELVILQTVLDQRRFAHCSDSLINKSIGQLGKLSKEIQEISMSLRMVPLKSTFQKMSRIVRDTSKMLNKQVDLRLVGEETEVDKTVLEYLADPLVHIIRNAVDHGLETPDKRTAAGKEPEGIVELKAFHEGSNLVIQITDDGNGIDPDVIRRKAIEKNLISENKEIPDHEMIQYIFHPGFSTKDVVSEVSGRGVGMDVVKTNIENLSGKVELKSKLGSGSNFKIVLPLTMAIIDGIIISSGDERFIIPLVQVHEFLRPSEKMLHHVSGLGDCLNLRDEIIPIFKLGKHLKSKTAKKEIRDSIVIIVKGSGHATFSIQVDDIINQQQVVIKKIGEEVKDQKGIMGCSILGDGKPAFIVDLFELLKDQIKERENAYQQQSRQIENAA